MPLISYHRRERGKRNSEILVSAHHHLRHLTLRLLCVNEREPVGSKKSSYQWLSEYRIDNLWSYLSRYSLLAVIFSPIPKSYVD